MEEIIYEFGMMSSKYELKAYNKLTAYATMAMFYGNSAPWMVIYSPEEAKKDNWFSPDGKISARLDEIFGSDGSFDRYVENNIENIRECYKTIKQLI